MTAMDNNPKPDYDEMFRRSQMTPYSDGHSESEPTYDTPGSYEEVTYCERCGKEMSRVKIEVPVKTRPDDTPSGGDTPGNNSGSTPASNTPAKSANTGDESPIMMCYILMMVGLVGVAGTFAAKKKGFRKNH